MTPLSVVCFKWQPKPGYRSTFGPETVNTLARMVARHYPWPHRFICVTDDPVGLSPDVDVVPLWSDFAGIPSPHGALQPSCYRRLKAFSPEAAQFFGPRFVCLDLDTVITGDLTPLWNRSEDFIIWGETDPRSWYNGSMFLLTAGARTKVWETFDPATSPHTAKAAGKFGSDQGWISYCLGKGEKIWTQKDGVYSYRSYVVKHGNKLPANARMVMFHGHADPWTKESQKIPWIKAHYC